MPDIKSKPVANKGKVVEEEEDDSDDDDDDDEPTLRKQFQAFVQFRNENNPGTHITLSQSDFWMKQAGILKVRTLTTTDTGVCFFKFKKYKLNLNEYTEFLEILANYKNIAVDEIIRKLVNCGPPPQETNVNLALTPR